MTTPTPPPSYQRVRVLKLVEYALATWPPGASIVVDNHTAARWFAEKLATPALAGRLRHAHGPNCVMEREGQPCPLGELPGEIYTRAYQDADEILAARGQPAPDPHAVEGG